MMEKYDYSIPELGIEILLDFENNAYLKYFFDIRSVISHSLELS